MRSFIAWHRVKKSAFIIKLKRFAVDYIQLHVHHFHFEIYSVFEVKCTQNNIGFVLNGWIYDAIKKKVVEKSNQTNAMTIN